MDEHTKTEEPMESPAAAYKTYETKEDWQAEIDGIIGGRLKNYRVMRDTLTQYEPIMKELMRTLETDEVEQLPVVAKEKLLERRLEELDMEALQAEFSEPLPGDIANDRYFRLAIKAGLAPKEACELALKNRSAARPPAEELPRPAESAISGDHGVYVRPAPSKMSPKELDEISRRVAMGEIITL